MRSVLPGDIAAELAILFDGRPDADMNGGEHCLVRDHPITSQYSTPKQTNSGVCVMAVSNFAFAH
jgi:hypothetical protein